LDGVPAGFTYINDRRNFMFDTDDITLADDLPVEDDDIYIT
jgi:hypothetical protein